MKNKENLGQINGKVVIEGEVDPFIKGAQFTSKLKTFARLLIHNYRVNESCCLEYDDDYPFGLEIEENKEGYLIKWHINIYWVRKEEYLLPVFKEEK